MSDDTEPTLDFENKDTEQATPDYLAARAAVSGDITKYSVEILEHYSQTMPRNEALGMVIEALSVSLGNVISLVKEEHQQEVIDDANQVIHMGLLSQTELIASMSYGQIGHA